MGSLGNQGPVEELIVLLGHQEASVRLGAAEGLGCLGARDKVEKILPLLKDEDDAVRMKAAWALGWIGRPKDGKELLAVARKPDENPKVRVQAIEAAARIDPKSSSEIAALLKDADELVRLDAAWTLGWVGARDRVGDLGPLLKDPDPSVREQACHAIGALATKPKDASQIGELRALEKDPEWNVRGAATLALVRLGEKIPAAERALVEEILSHGPQGERLLEPFLQSMIALHEKEVSNLFSREIALEAPVSTLDDLRTAIRPLGFQISAPDGVALRQTLPKGTCLTILRFLFSQDPKAMIGEERCLFVPEGKTLRLIPQSEVLEYWQKRLKAK